MSPDAEEYAKALLDFVHGNLEVAIDLLRCRTTTRIYDGGWEGLLSTITKNNAVLRALLELVPDQVEMLDLTKIPQFAVPWASSPKTIKELRKVLNNERYV
jgi:hypothetical protein